MGGVDIFFLLVLLASLVLGLWRGLVYEVLSLVGWVLAFFLAQWYAEDAAAYLPLGSTAEPLRYAAGFAVVFIATAFASAFVAWLIQKGIESVGLRPVDRALGAAFGALRGVVILLALALVVNMTPLKEEEAWRTSVGAGWLHAGLRTAKGAMPENIAQYFP
ncbi:CvpA family protein [Macromonas nakdongensis]|uniref:CvpA family protein n=1 Tax=Macromonas nakdongensis TaxID=1843082 RepID=UPI000C321F69|nr:CvpA family protein [Macromonas nakdongensis]